MKADSGEEKIKTTKTNTFTITDTGRIDSGILLDGENDDKIYIGTGSDSKTFRLPPGSIRGNGQEDDRCFYIPSTKSPINTVLVRTVTNAANLVVNEKYIVAKGIISGSDFNNLECLLSIPSGEWFEIKYRETVVRFKNDNGLLKEEDTTPILEF